LTARPKGQFGLFFTGLFVFTAIFAPLLAPFDPNRQDLLSALVPPHLLPTQAGFHPFGTDALGRDVLSRVVFGTRVSLIVGTMAVAASLAIGMPVGVVAGYFGGLTDDMLSRLTDTVMSLPFLVVVLALMAVLRPSLANIILVLALTSWAPYARLARSQTLAVRELDYIEASRATGAGARRILRCHVLPNVAVPVLVVASLQVGTMILAEASLAFLGVGVQPPLVSWGSMSADGWSYLRSAWWVATFPGSAVSLVVVSLNLFGDALRDVADPVTRRR
jgi:peptide/nickel transport system permease protein